MRLFGLFFRLWIKGFVQGDSRPETIVRWVFYPIALWSALVTLGVIPPFSFAVPFGLYYGLPDHTLHPFGFHAVLLVVLILVFASYEAGVAWMKARWMTPRLSPVFGVGPPFEMETTAAGTQGHRTVYWQRFRIGVKNESNNTINQVGLDLVDIHPQFLRDVIQLPLPLQPMHALDQPLNPGRERMFDIVSRGYLPNQIAAGIGETIEICNTVRPMYVPLCNLELILQLHGTDVPSISQRVAITADITGRLSFSLLPRGS